MSSAVMANRKGACFPQAAISATEQPYHAGSVAVDPVREPRRAFWQTSSCPAWCDVDHRRDLWFEERNHFTSFGDMDLTLYADLRAGRVDIEEGKPASPPAPGHLMVSMNQHYREIEPTISLTVPTNGPTDHREVVGEVDVEMTLAEAQELIALLTVTIAASESEAR